MTTTTDRLDSLERIVLRGLRESRRLDSRAAEVGDALTMIRDSKLFGKGTFEDYIKSRFAITKVHGYRLIGYARVLHALPSDPARSNARVTRLSQRAALVLKDCDDESVKRVYGEALNRANGKPITSATLRAILNPPPDVVAEAILTAVTTATSGSDVETLLDLTRSAVEALTGPQRKKLFHELTVAAKAMGRASKLLITWKSESGTVRTRAAQHVARFQDVEGDRKLLDETSE